MSNKTLLTIHSVIYAIFAIALFFLAEFMWPLYGVEINDKYALFLSQHNSIFLGGIAVIGFLFLGSTDNNEMIQKLLTGLMWTNIFGLIITLYMSVTGIFSGFGWSDPAFFALLSGLLFNQIKKNKTSPE